MRYLIDGYNLLFRVSKSYAAMKREERRILQLLSESARKKGWELVFVFDGQHRDPHEPIRSNLYDLEIVTTQKAQSADNYLIQCVEEAKNPRECILVSSDREVLGRGRQLGAEVMTIEVFLKKILNAGRKGEEEKKVRKADPREFERWLRLFENTG